MKHTKNQKNLKPYAASQLFSPLSYAKLKNTIVDGEEFTMANSTKQTGVSKPGWKKIIMLCLILSNILFCYQWFLIFQNVINYSIPYLPVLSNGLIPLALILACVLLCLAKKVPAYGISRAVIMAVISLACHFVPPILSRHMDWPFESYVIFGLVFCAAAYLCAALAFSKLFIVSEHDWNIFLIMTLVLPVGTGTLMFCLKPDWAVQTLALLLIFSITISMVGKYVSLSPKHKAMIKGAVKGSIIAGDAGAIIGAEIAKDRFEGGGKKK